MKNPYLIARQLLAFLKDELQEGEREEVARMIAGERELTGLVEELKDKEKIRRELDRFFRYGESAEKDYTAKRDAGGKKTIPGLENSSRYSHFDRCFGYLLVVVGPFAEGQRVYGCGTIFGNGSGHLEKFFG